MSEASADAARATPGGGKPLAPTLPPLPPAFALESSALGFPDLCRLVAFYCVSRST